jgi:hypothetical protein
LTFDIEETINSSELSLVEHFAVVFRGGCCLAGINKFTGARLLGASRELDCIHSELAYALFMLKFLPLSDENEKGCFCLVVCACSFGLGLRARSAKNGRVCSVS